MVILQRQQLIDGALTLIDTQTAWVGPGEDHGDTTLIIEMPWIHI